MSWKKLTIDDLRLVLAEDEVEKLNNLSLDPEIVSVVNTTIDVCADAWRGALKSKGFEMDIRDHFIPPSYIFWVLVFARQAVWSRFPMSPDIAIDDVRKGQYEDSVKLLKDPYIDVTRPDWQYSDANPENRDERYWSSVDSIRVPFHRFPSNDPRIISEIIGQ